MKLHILHNASGKILAAADLTESDDGPRPVPRRGQRDVVLVVPPEHRSKGFLEICQTFRIDPKAGTLVAPRKKAGGGKPRIEKTGKARK